MSLSPQGVAQPPMRRGPIRSTQNFAGGLFLLALAALALYLARNLPQGSLRSMGPAMLPDWLAYGVGACGFALVVMSLLRDGEALAKSSLRGPVVVLLAILAFAMTIRPFSLGAMGLPGLGMVVAGPLAIIIGGYATPDVRLRPLLILALSLTPFCMVLFGDLLNLPIPIFPQSFANLFPASWSQKEILRATAVVMAIAALALFLTGRRRPSNRIDVVDHSGTM
ncbi:tripartite tricarboxylate transporter TctB family protein [Microvirga brassicacearum]|uniref:Tripartite tricarboxylate transporter TctB family protein n=1 Tax=Microvirga brassicacearum TaxID=2580413 RepID=A0A5N3P3N7_9HYPH|nr:tripartite tricarboxylate transporter TctB family protein [Microvirga brassicacearum]KAB0264348.1 tripartite tricarboxylate transporter TctB family protein [Microvirga brassicacearum]